jgi:GH25 family lysozyme M1 (1,4-beta-N-acetylmuramidase)
MRAHGIDISKYDKHFEPSMATGTIDFVIQRSGYGMVRDEKFEQLLPGVKKIGIRGAYHYLSSGVPWKDQADRFLEIVTPHDYHFYAADFEKYYNNLNAAFANTAMRFVEYVKEQTQKPCLLYTNPTHYTHHLLPYVKDWVETVDLWLARYFSLYWYKYYKAFGKLDKINPTLPRGRTKPWKFWQYIADGNNQGDLYGVGRSYTVDLNFYNGTVDELREWTGKNGEQDNEEPDEQLDLSGALQKFSLSAKYLQEGMDMLKG